MPSIPRSNHLAEAAFRRASSLYLGGALAFICACSADRIVEPAPVATVPTATSDLQRQAFKLSIDVASGLVDVTPPSRRTATVDGPSFSLLGDDAIQLSLTSWTCAMTLPDRTKKRCTGDLAIRNRLAATDMVTPTTFPRPPQGTNGILVFPFSATVSPGGEEVVPSPDWDLGPANFFNDASCSGSGKTDCFRYEVFPSPLYALTSASRQIGFDIPANATGVTLYVVVSADLRDNPWRTAILPTVEELCGMIDFYEEEPRVIMPNYPGDQLLYVDSKRITFCSFRNTLPGGVRVQSAGLRVFSWGGLLGDGDVMAQRVNWGPTLEPSDVLLPTLNTQRSFAIEDASYAGATYMWYVARNLKDAVQGALAEGQTYVQFRIMREPSGTGSLYFFGPVASTIVRPQLVVQYTVP
jgi:hypothetical protein